MVSKRIKRRDFLQQSAFTTGAVCLASSNLCLASEDASPPDDGLRYQNFETLVGEAFRIQSDDQSWRVVLADAKLVPLNQHDRRPSQVRQEPFSLLFVSGSSIELENKIYTVRHPRLASVDLFLHRIGPTKTSIATYQAVVN